MSRRGKSATRSSPTMQEEQIKLSSEEVAAVREMYGSCANEWEILAQDGIIPRADLEKLKTIAGVV